MGGIARERVQGGREGEFFSITTGNWFSRKQCRKSKIYRSIFIITFTNICLELQLSLRRKRNRIRKTRRRRSECRGRRPVLGAEKVEKDHVYVHAFLRGCRKTS